MRQKDIYIPLLLSLFFTTVHTATSSHRLIDWEEVSEGAERRAAIHLLLDLLENIPLPSHIEKQKAEGPAEQKKSRKKKDTKERTTFTIPVQEVYQYRSAIHFLINVAKGEADPDSEAYHALLAREPIPAEESCRESIRGIALLTKGLPFDHRDTAGRIKIFLHRIAEAVKQMQRGEEEWEAGDITSFLHEIGIPKEGVATCLASRMIDRSQLHALHTQHCHTIHHTTFLKKCKQKGLIPADTPIEISSDELIALLQQVNPDKIPALLYGIPISFLMPIIYIFLPSNEEVDKEEKEEERSEHTQLTTEGHKLA